jgi:pimeloyl-ACP methyl ester carboxylesterase
VDDDRIYMAGYSQGGHGTWHMATMFPRLFAAVVPMAGIPHFEGNPYTFLSYMPNLEHLPMWSIWGEKDRIRPGSLGNVDYNRLAMKRLKKLGNETFKGTEYPGVGHLGCWPKRGQFAAYLAKHRRKPMPEEFTRHFHLAHHGRAYYVEAVKLSEEPIDFDKPPKIRLTRPPPSRPWS